MSKVLELHPEKCTGCHTCELMCSFKWTESFNPKIAAIGVKDNEEELTSKPVICLQCGRCAKVCPQEAISKADNGAFVIDYDNCIECEACVGECPIGRIKFWSEGSKIVKCNLCLGGEPQCAKFCSAGAIVHQKGDAS